jgi:hypothetical protein
VEAESSGEDSAEDQPLFSADSAEKLPSQTSQFYVIQEKIEMVRTSEKGSECNYLFPIIRNKKDMSISYAKACYWAENVNV